jgi:hypothetical protein
MRVSKSAVAKESVTESGERNFKKYGAKIRELPTRRPWSLKGLFVY